MRRRLPAVLALLLLAAGPLETLPEASAAWATSGSAALPGTTARMPAGDPAAPMVTVVGVYPATRTFTVSWSTVRPFGGRPATGYVLTRNATLSGAPMDDGSCKGTVVAGVTGVYVPADPAAPVQSCTDTTTLNLGSVQYTVTPVWTRWIGGASAASTAVQ